MVETVHEAAVSTAAKFIEKRVSIKAVQDCRDYSALTNTVGEGEHTWVAVVSLNVGILLHVDEHEDRGETREKKFVEQNTMLNQVKSLGHVHTAGEDVGPIPHEVADGLYHTPGAHCRRTARLVSKSQLIKTKSDSKQGEDDPIDQFKDKTTDRYLAIIFTAIDTS